MNKHNPSGELKILHDNYSIVLCGEDKRAIQKHNKVEYKKKELSEIIDHVANGGNVAILAGSRSNNIECLDFDLKNSENENFLPEYWDLVREQLGDEFIKSLVIQTTPSGGMHLLYRTSKVDGSKKISKGKNGEAIVESRGEGGYFLVAPSKNYILLGGGGDFSHVPVITPSEKHVLWTSAKMLEELDEPDPVIKSNQYKESALSNMPAATSDTNVWDEFNEKADYRSMLEEDGWTVMQEKGNKFLMRRPDKTDYSWSADLELSGHGVPLLYVYSSSTVLEQEKAYSPSSYLINYRFHGDAVRAYDWLIENSYAPPRKVEANAIPTVTLPTSEEEAKDLLDKYEEHRIDDQTPIERPVPILTINGVGVLHTGELLTLSGESKSGKSALLSAIMAKVLNEGAQGFEIIKTEKTDYPIIHFDTEQPRHRHKDNLVYHVMRRAGLEEYPKQLLSYNVRNMSVLDRRAMATEVVESAQIQYGGVFMVILDGLADFIQDTNNIEQSADVVHWVLEMSTKYNCGVIDVIHLNPSPDGAYIKQRGHLGSELQRKTDNLLVVKKDVSQGSEKSVLTAQYLRNGGIFNFGEHYIHYDERTKMHQLIDLGQEEVNPTERFKVLAQRVAGQTLATAVRNLVDGGYYETPRKADSAIKELIKYEYLSNDTGVLMKNGNLFEPNLNEIEEIDESNPNGKAPF